MNHDQQIKRLIRARKRIDKRLRELDLKIEHLFWRVEEDRRTLAGLPRRERDEDFGEFLLDQESRLW